MHLVNVTFEPIEEAAHAIPFVLVAAFLIVGLAFDYEGLLAFGQFGVGDVGPYLALLGDTLKVTQALAVDFTLKGADCAVVD